MHVILCNNDNCPLLACVSSIGFMINIYNNDNVELVVHVLERSIYANKTLGSY